MRHLVLAFTLGLLGPFAVPPVAARAELLTDNGFETTQLGPFGYSYVGGTLNNWVYSAQASGSGGLLINSGGGNIGAWVDVSQTGFGGDQVAGIQGLGVISQTFSPVSSGTYTVSWVDAGRNGAFGDDGSQTYIASLQDETTALLVAASTFATTTGSNFNPESFAASLTAGDVYTLSFTGQLSADQTALIDDVSVDDAGVAVPEPGSLVILGAGIVGVAWVRRRHAV